MTPAREALEEAKLKRDDKQDEFDEVDRRWSANDRNLAEFEDRTGARGARGGKLDELETLTRDEATIKAELTVHQQRLRTAKDRADELTAEKNTVQATMLHRGGILPGQRTIPEIDADIANIRADIRTAENEVATRQARLDREAQLEQEKQQVENRRGELAKEKRERDSELKRVKSEVQRRERELQDALALRTSQEQDLVNGFKNVFTEAANEVINAEIERLSQALTSELEVLKQQTQDQNEKAMYDALQQRWIRTETRYRGILRRRAETYRPINRAAVDADFNVLMTQGPEDVMRSLLMSRVNPDTGANYTQPEADAILAEKAYVEKMQPEMVKQLLAKRVLSGGISQEDIQVITMSHWGQGMIEGALAKNKEFREAVEGVMGAGAVARHGFWERFGQQMRQHPWWWLLLLGAPIAFGLGAHRMTPQEEEISV